jgi:hypothetical protein
MTTCTRLAPGWLGQFLQLGRKQCGLCCFWRPCVNSALSASTSLWCAAENKKKGKAQLQSALIKFYCSFDTCYTYPLVLCTKINAKFRLGDTFLLITYTSLLTNSYSATVFKTRVVHRFYGELGPPSISCSVKNVIVTFLNHAGVDCAI